jgi:hypothetical protein
MSGIKTEIKQESEMKMVVKSEDKNEVSSENKMIRNIPQDNIRTNLIYLGRNINNTSDRYATGQVIFYIFHVIMSLIAIILSLRCNNKSVDFGSLLVAIFFPYIYIIYILGTKNLKEQCDISI